MTRRSDWIHPSFFPWFLGVPCALALAVAPAAQLGTVVSEQKISETQGGFGGVLDDEDLFGVAVSSLGDLDGDGNRDLAVGVSGDDDGDGINQGAVWVLFLNSDGTVASEQKISETQGGFGGVLGANDRFGSSVATLGDLDGDGNPELAVGASGDGPEQGAVWILFLNADGTVGSEQKISETTGGFAGVLDPVDFFGDSVSPLGDLDGDGNEDIAVGARGDDDGGVIQGAIWILFLNADGTVASEQKISETSGLGDVLLPNDAFGTSVGTLGDLDGEGSQDLAVGAPGGGQGGAVWVLFLNPDGTIASKQKISETAGGFGGVLETNDGFGSSVSRLGDLDGDWIPELAVGARYDGDENQGAVWILFLNSDGTVASEQKINETEGGFGGVLDGPNFGVSVSSLGDLDGDGVPDLVVGNHLDDDGGALQGAVWILFLEGVDVPHPFLRRRGPPVPFVGSPTTVALISPAAGGPLAQPIPARPSLTGGERERVGADLELSCPAAEPILSFDVADARIELSDGTRRVTLFSSAASSAGTTTMSVFADLSKLFPRTSDATVLRLVARSEGAQSRFGNLRWHGGATVRNGSGANAVSLVSASTPTAGHPWQAWVDVSARPHARASLVFAGDRALAGTASRFGELLVDVLSRRPLFTSLVASHGATDVHAVDLPSELLGRSFSLQALILDGHGSALTNAVDLVVGR